MTGLVLGLNKSIINHYRPTKKGVLRWEKADGQARVELENADYGWTFFRILQLNQHADLHACINTGIILFIKSIKVK